MLVPAVKQRASNNLIMRLEILGAGGRGGRCRPSAARAPPAACGASKLSARLLPLTLLLISSLPCCCTGRWGRSRVRLPPPWRGGAGEHRLLCCSLPCPLAVPLQGRDALPGAGWEHGWSTSHFPGCRRGAALTSCLADAIPPRPDVRSFCREGKLEAGKLSQLCAVQQPRWSLWGQDARGARAASQHKAAKPMP